MAVRLAIEDFGGPGAPLLLLHGAGANLVSVAALARELSPRFRVVTVDLRGHGRSEDGPWEWTAVLDDLETVTADLNLGEPAVVGWSLGGMLAALWAERHPDCPMAVSIDGTPPPARPEQLDGLDPADAEAEIDRLRAAFDGMAAVYARPLAPEEVEAAVEGQRAMARRVGAPEEPAADGFRRNLVTRDGRTWMRPSPDVLAGLRTAMEALDVIPVYRRVRCPLLVAVATEDLPEQRPFQELYAAYRRGFERRLAEAAEANPALQMVRVEGASHAMVAERPAELAKLITEFADRV
ncbi:alpha/beta fold hydrolase [Actinoallomurus rhizosphaericola]|uniref:alpha/beta fold hydrolase n=1 Tax=Actinoallomurus rhizosphaericola TaxID=2952536 RepID=UPI002091DC4E|nr:alpha/beta hydrolase [Actinoallomurus rhizosphaericola]MCO5991822.1 alpha/beta hydrolase [Actinoallomurus rhizosphaericola]